MLTVVISLLSNGITGLLIVSFILFCILFFPPVTEYYCYHQKKQHLSFFFEALFSTSILVNTYSVCCPLSAGLCHCHYKNNSSRVQPFCLLFLSPQDMSFQRAYLSHGVLISFLVLNTWYMFSTVFPRK